MTIRDHYNQCICAIEALAHEYVSLCSGVKVPTHQADCIALHLMQASLNHLGSTLLIAKQPEVRSTWMSGWALIRSSYEAALIACWLVSSDDTSERDARALGWLREQLKTNKVFANNLPGVVGKVFLDENVQISAEIDRQLKALGGTHLGKSYEKRPSIIDMLNACGFEDHQYVTYCIGSAMAHATPTLVREMLRNVGQSNDLECAKWAKIFLFAGWALGKAGIPVLQRVGVTESQLKTLRDCFGKSVVAARQFEQSVAEALS